MTCQTMGWSWCTGPWCPFSGYFMERSHKLTGINYQSVRQNTSRSYLMWSSLPPCKCSINLSQGVPVWPVVGVYCTTTSSGYNEGITSSSWSSTRRHLITVNTEAKQMTPWLLNNGHYDSEACRLWKKHRPHLETLHSYFEVNWVASRVNLYPLEETATFPYLRRMSTLNSIGWLELYSNLRNPQRGLGMVKKVLGTTGETVKSQAIMKNSVLQEVIMYGR